MQTLWSRVAQVRGGCRCPQCLSVGNGVTRRATANATQRMPKYLTSSTLWYSGIFAAAATFDAGVKKQRREQWDLAIADVKQELELPAAAKSPQRAPQEDQDLRDSQIQFRPFGNSSKESDVFRDIDIGRSKPRWPTNTGPELSVHRLSPESIYATDLRKSTAERISLSPKKLANIEAAVELLQLNIFAELRRRNSTIEAGKVVPEEFAKHILQDTVELERQLEVNRDVFASLAKADAQLSNYSMPADHIRLCSFAQENTDDKIQSVRDLNLSLQDLFNLGTTQKLGTPSLLAKLCYNLSLCQFPPNLNTFNTLLLGFSRIQEPSLTDHVIRSLRKCHMRPNEVTLASILRHYTRTAQSDRFVYWIELIRGKHSGLGLARPDISINNAGRTRLVRNPHAPDKVIQLPYATPYVFSAIIEGVIKFAGFDTALEVCKNMRLEGWGLCMSGLTPLLRNCAERGDWVSGSAVWSQISALKASSRRREGGRWISERIQLDAFAAMLRLCSRCHRKDDFETVWTQASRVHSHARDELVRLVRDGPMTDSQGQAWPIDEVFSVSDGVARDVMVKKDEAAVIDHPTMENEASLTSTAHIQRDNGVLNELPVVKHTSNENLSTTHLEGGRTMPKSTASAPDTKTTSQKSTYRWPTADRLELLEEQFYGNFPPSEELSEYELRERPMSIQT